MTRSVVGFDASEPSRSALAWALDHADPVVVAHVADSDPGLMGSDYADQVRARASSLLEATLARLELSHPHRDLTGVLLDGPVPWALAQFARPEDTLVIGTHKTGFLHGRVLGSRSVEVAMLARCDVVVVPSTDLRFRAGVVAGIADDPGLGAVVGAAARAAADRGEELLLVHGTENRHPENERTVVAEALALARAAAPGVVVRARASNRSTAELLLDAARDRALLVVGTGTGDRTRSPLGSVLHDVLLNLTAPVLVTHPSPAPASDSGRPARVAEGT